MDITKIAIQALVQSCVALASVNTLKSCILTSDEQKNEYTEKFRKNMMANLESIEELIGEKSLSNIVTALKEQGLL